MLFSIVFQTSIQDECKDIKKFIQITIDSINNTINYKNDLYKKLNFWRWNPNHPVAAAQPNETTDFSKNNWTFEMPLLESSDQFYRTPGSRAEFPERSVSLEINIFFFLIKKKERKEKNIELYITIICWITHFRYSLLETQLMANMDSVMQSSCNYISWII